MFYWKVERKDFYSIKQFFVEFGDDSVLDIRSLDGAILCESGANIIGFVGLEIHGRVGVGTALLVRPGFRSCGVGKHLVDLAKAAAVDSHVEEIYMWSHDAEFYFRAQGMLPCELHECCDLSHETVQVLEKKKAGSLLSLVLKAGAAAAA